MLVASVAHQAQPTVNGERDRLAFEGTPNEPPRRVAVASAPRGVRSTTPRVAGAVRREHPDRRARVARGRSSRWSRRKPSACSVRLSPHGPVPGSTEIPNRKRGYTRWLRCHRNLSSRRPSCRRWRWLRRFRSHRSVRRRPCSRSPSYTLKKLPARCTTPTFE
jgi:hypothetical protein